MYPTGLWDLTLGSARAIVGTSQDQPSEPTSAPGRVKCGHLAAYLRSGVTMAACFGFSRCLLCQLIALSQIFGEKLALTLFMATAAFAHSSANSADPHSEFISPKVGAWVGGSQVVPGPTHRHSIPGMKLQAVARMSEGVGSPSLSSRTPLFTEDRAGILIMPHPSLSTLAGADGKQGQNLRLSGPLTIAPRLIPSY